MVLGRVWNYISSWIPFGSKTTMKKGGTAPAPKGGQKHEPVGASASTQPPKTSEPSLTKTEVAAIVEKTVSEAWTRQKSELQVEISKSAKQQVQDVGDRLQELRDKSLDADAKNVQRFKGVDNTLSDLSRRCGLLEKLVKEELDGIVEAKVRLILRKIQPANEVEEDKQRWSEQLARSDSVHQEEIQKLQQQHHQDMLSVINDCCGKLKTSFTRQNKPYDVREIHNTIDDIQQKLIREILCEIEKTDIHEDLSSFGEALAKSELSHEVGEAREFNRLSSDDIAASLDAFDSGDITSFSQDLENIADAVAEVEAQREPVVENISATRSMITGDRGNVYYTEELKRTVDDIIALGDPTGARPSDAESSPSLPQVTRSQSEVEKSLESMIISGGFEADVEGLTSTDLKEKDKTIKDPGLGGISKTSELLPETTSMDLDQLKSLEALAEGDFSWTDIQPSTKLEPEVPKSHEAAIKPATTASAPSHHDQARLRSPEPDVECDLSLAGIQPSSKVEPEVSKSREAAIKPATTASTPSHHDQARLKSLEPDVECDLSLAGIQPSSKVEPKVSKSHEAVIKPAATASAPSHHDQAKLKSLEAEVEGDMSWAEIQPSTKVEPKVSKSREAVKQPVSTTSASSHHDRVKPVEDKKVQSAEAALDRDQMQALEDMLEAQMTDSPAAVGGNAVQGQVEPTKSAKQQVKANVSEQVTSSALPTTETIKVTPRTGYGENPHYVKDVLNASAPTAKDKP